MIQSNLYKTLLIGLFIALLPCSYASETKDSPSIYMSNNTEQISITKAYSRILYSDQLKLKDNVINILQKHHVQQGKFTTLLGVYKNYGDNTEEFTFSPYEQISESSLNNIAHEITTTLNQHSVLVFIPEKYSKTKEISVEFAKEKEPKFQQVINTIHKKLDSKYAQNFSMHLDNSYNGINKSTVTKIVWFGKDFDNKALKKAFPNSNITIRYGKAYLIYQDGKQDLL